MVRDKSLESFIEALDEFREATHILDEYEKDPRYKEIPSEIVTRYKEASRELRDRLYYLKDI